MSNTTKKSNSKPALFLDRDGVLINFVNYISDPNQVVLKDGVIELLKKARQAGWLIVVVTNQSGLGRGLFSWETYIEVQNKIATELKNQGQALDAVYVSPYFKEGTLEISKQGEDLRKPKPGMFFLAESELNIDLSRSAMIGDSASDIEAAVNAGVPHRFFLKSNDSDEVLMRNRLELPKLQAHWNTQVIESFSMVFGVFN